MVRPWHKMAKEAVTALSLEVLQARWDGALRNLVLLKVLLPIARRLKHCDL